MGDTNVNDLSLQVGVAGDKWATQRVPKSISKFLGWDAAGVVGAFTASFTAAANFSVHKNGINQTGFGAVATKITWSTAAFDSATAFDLANERYIAPVTGVYLFNFNITVTNITSGSILLSLRKNGTAIAFYNSNIATAGDTFSFTSLLSLTATDYIEVWAEASAVATYDIDGTATKTNFVGYSL